MNISPMIMGERLQVLFTSMSPMSDLQFGVMFEKRQLFIYNFDKKVIIVHI